MKIHFNEIATKQYLLKLTAWNELERDSLFNDYDTFHSIILGLNSTLSVLNIYEDSVIFVSKMLGLMNQIEEINENYLLKYQLKCSIFILEDLKLHDQQKKLRYHQLFKIESKSYDRLYSLRRILEFYNETGKLNYQFVLFFLPMKLTEIGINELISDSRGLISIKKRRKNVVQRIFITDLSKDKVAWERFLKLKFLQKIGLVLFKLKSFFTRNLRTPHVIKLYRHSKILFKILLLLAFFFDLVSPPALLTT